MTIMMFFGETFYIGLANRSSHEDRYTPLRLHSALRARSDTACERDTEPEGQVFQGKVMDPNGAHVVSQKYFSENSSV
jgi:hypothetical protein